MVDENPPLSVARRSTEGLALDNAVLRIDKGRVAPPSAADEQAPVVHAEHIPWGYGRDRITAMVVDPNRLYVYWELTDPSIERARHGLSSGGKDAWLNLRVYDVTGRIFDGTNAHGYFDIKVDRSDRHWFIHIGKPASTHLVEVGLKSYEGYFVKILRSGRADFPRFEPSPDGTVDWLTVRTATGPVDDPHRGGAPDGESGGGSSAGPGAGAAGGEGANTRDWRTSQPMDGTGAIRLTEWSWAGWEELFHTEWIDGRRFLEWSTPVIRSSWEKGPFALPVELPTTSEERFEGPVTVYPLEDGRSRIVYGPWQVVIRGIGGKAESHTITRWEMEASWVVSMGFERVVRQLVPSVAGAFGEIAPATLGSSEALGASERRWLSASELRLRGASEVHFIGASELRLGGASETILGSASERRILGGSERVGWGSSEFRVGGASEKILGSSETRIGASERPGESPYAIDDGAPPSPRKGA
jgi:uncharacterized protein